MRPEATIKLNFSNGLIVELFLTLAIALCTVLHVSNAVTVCFTMTFVVFLFLLIRYFSSTAVPISMILLLSIAFFNVVLNALLTQRTQIDFNYFKKYIMFLCTVLYLYAAADVKLSRTCRHVLSILPLIIGTVLIGSYYLFGNRTMIAGNPTLGFINPNFAGMWLVHVLFYAVYDAVAYKSIPLKVYCGILIVLDLVLIIKIYARSCFLGILAFAILLPLGIFRKKYNLSKGAIVVITISPLLIALAYLAIENTAWFANTFSFLIRVGKKLNARNELWLSAISTAKNHLILGNYSGISGGMGMSQLHNTHIDVLCSYGIVPFVLFVASLSGIMLRINRRIHCIQQYLAFCAFTGIIFVGAFEAALVSGSTGLYFLSGGMLFLASQEDSEQKQLSYDQEHIEVNHLKRRAIPSTKQYEN